MYLRIYNFRVYYSIYKVSFQEENEKRQPKTVAFLAFPAGIEPTTNP